MFRSAYLTFTKVFQVFDLPFPSDNLNGIRAAFHPIFSKKYNEDVIYADYEYFTSKKPYPFIRNIGPVRFWIPPYMASKNPEYYFAEYGYGEELPTATLRKGTNINTYYHGLTAEADDQRFTFFHYRLEKPVRLTAYENGIRVARGIIMVSLYSCGFVVVNVSISLDNSTHACIDDVLPVHTFLNPWDARTRVPWEWRSGVGNGTLAKIVNRVVTHISDSIFMDGTFVGGSKWQRSVKLHGDLTAEEVTEKFNLSDPARINGLRNYPHEPYSWRCRNGYGEERGNWRRSTFKSSNPHNYILFSDGLDIHNWSGKVKAGWVLHRFWNYRLILEKAMIEKFIIDRYCDFFTEEIEQLRLWRLDRMEQLREDRFLRLNSFSSTIYKHISYINSQTRSLKPFNRRLYSEYSRSVGLDRSYKRLKKLKPLWETECERYESMGIKVGKKLKNAVIGFITAATSGVPV